MTALFLRLTNLSIAAGWLVLAVLWLLYRSSGDRELLIALGAYLIL